MKCSPRKFYPCAGFLLVVLGLVVVLGLCVVVGGFFEVVGSAASRDFLLGGLVVGLCVVVAGRLDVVSLCLVVVSGCFVVVGSAASRDFLLGGGVVGLCVVVDDCFVVVSGCLVVVASLALEGVVLSDEDFGVVVDASLFSLSDGKQWAAATSNTRPNKMRSFMVTECLKNFKKKI